MRHREDKSTFFWFAALLAGLCCAVSSAIAGDLPAASDGEHLWLIQQTPPPADDQDAEPTLTIYHLPADTKSYRANKLDPIEGELMPRGFTAGDGRLLIVTADRKLITLRAQWSDLLRTHEYQQRTLTALPEGCTLLALAMGDRGPWALVQVQSGELLKRLDAQDEQLPGLTDDQIFNMALGLPEDFQWRDEPAEPSQEEPNTDEPADESAEVDEQGEEAAEPPAEETTEADADEVLVEEPVLPAYRLIHLRSNRWTSSPLPEGFDVPRQATILIRPGEERPILLIDGEGFSRHMPMLVRYNPVSPEETPVQSDAEEDAEPGENETEQADPSPAWERLVTRMRLRPGRQWSASLINGEIVVALERNRPLDSVTIDSFRFRDGDAYEIGSAWISTGENARWAIFPWQEDIGLFASPAPPPDSSEDAGNRLPILGHFAGLSMNGEPLFQNKEGQTLLMPIAENKPTAFEGNADLIIQILAFITAMFMMVMFYRKAPQHGQLDLPDHLVLASFGRRAIAGMIDLAPGFILAGLIYNVSVGQILLESWPGNGIEKAFAAMRPGFVVIFVTLFHTTICEFILARSLGKIVMGMYVADLNGKPAPPMPCLGRALSRAFELFAPLMILVAVISPARQRLGDILAKTTIVMRKPEPIQFDDE